MFTNCQIEKYVWKNTEHCMSVRKVNKSSQALPEKIATPLPPQPTPYSPFQMSKQFVYRLKRAPP